MIDGCRLCTGEDHTALVEHVAEQMWLSRRIDASDPAWADAGEFWQERFRDLAAVAVQALR